MDIVTKKKLCTVYVCVRMCVYVMFIGLVDSYFFLNSITNLG